MAQFAGWHAFVDWDDTLKVTNALYNAVSRENAELVLAHVPNADLSVLEITERVHATDLQKTHRNGLHHRNYAEAWVEVYENLAAAHGVQALSSVSTALYQRAAAVPQMTQPDYPGNQQLLRELRRLGWEITIWTAGETAVQEAKIARAGFRSLVDRVCVVPEKSVTALRAALGERNPQMSCVIGNSPRSDIAPALECGLWAIHVLQDTWAYDAYAIDESHPGYFRVSSLGEIIPLLTDKLHGLAS